MSHITLERLALLLTTLVTVSTVLEKFFGINLIGKKIYKGAPALWKWVMGGTIFRKEMTKKVDEVLAEVTFNGGKSLKDIVKQLANITEQQTLMLVDMKSRMEFNTFRLDLSDMANDRMIFRLDKNGACTFINDAFLKFFGYTEHDVLKYSFESIIKQEDLPHLQEKIKRAIETENDFYSEHRICDIAGAEFPCIVRGFKILEQGKLKEFWGTIDIKD